VERRNKATAAKLGWLCDSAKWIATHASPRSAEADAQIQLLLDLENASLCQVAMGSVYIGAFGSGKRVFIDI